MELKLITSIEDFNDLCQYLKECDTFFSANNKRIENQTFVIGLETTDRISKNPRITYHLGHIFEKHIVNNSCRLEGDFVGDDLLVGYEHHFGCYIDGRDIGLYSFSLSVNEHGIFEVSIFPKRTDCSDNLLLNHYIRDAKVYHIDNTHWFDSEKHHIHISFPVIRKDRFYSMYESGLLTNQTELRYSLNDHKRLIIGLSNLKTKTNILEFEDLKPNDDIYVKYFYINNNVPFVLVVFPYYNKIILTDDSDELVKKMLDLLIRERNRLKKLE